MAEKTEGDRGWLFPVGDELAELGYTHMFSDMLDALDAGRPPMESFYDGYVVNAVMDACYRSIRSRAWEPVKLDIWRGGPMQAEAARLADFDAAHYLVKEELMPDGRRKLILKDKKSGRISEKIR